MVRAGALTQSRRPAFPGVWLVPPLLVAASAVIAVLTVPAAARIPVILSGAVATAAVTALALEVARRGRVTAALERRVEHQLAETHRLVRELPLLIAELEQEDSSGEAPARSPEAHRADPQLARAHEHLLHLVATALQDREYQRDSARRAIVNIACRIQSEVHRLQDDLRKMQFRHGSPEVLGDLMHLEHRVNVAGRVATGLAVLGGGSPVRQWQKPVALYDVLRAGSAPIVEYLRVEQHRVADIAVIGAAVEPLMLVLSELLDNATRYSPPSSSVVVNTEEVASGVEISVEDKGMGLTEEARARAEFLLTQSVDGLDLADLGESARIGLRVAGILATRHRLRISLRPSTCDGVRAVVFVPHELLTPLPMPAPLPGSRTAPAPVPAGRSVPQPRPGRLPAAPPADPPAPEDPGVHERSADGLPQRRRGQSVAAPATPSGGGPRPAPGGGPGAGPPAESGLWMGDFFGPAGPDEAPAPAPSSRTSNDSRN
ncbi:ATP-binding protein [Streptomyces sp. ACA25]|uniref:ATP-binding protein n=1 Tax=Streptomyces sp. ACA25 TaxID=3022596 RepID=UPI002307772B|nr:ATP-binding protein [Streptomyces sp. ACA25]MDB1087843.1 ATP-binding protein [Streptomyces sp. ACA25]